ncbi:fungal-specific transcription factor domain-containing protein [Armillaria luteobubalina]|uniref:Fungal-specific transcription factor domain-containing protein n=1 Tax=Armillaria luteobubalina TaxID=153913 RepID=A0AA39Q6Y3_9AGAR|nr:fungal-specific transcription factor domain-containing protein [Armillaria luteobubalina]
MSKRIQELEAALTNAGLPIPGVPMASSKAVNASHKRPRRSSASESSTDFSSVSADPLKTSGESSGVVLGFGTLTIDVENKTRYIGLSGASAYLNEDLWKTDQSRISSMRSSHEEVSLSNKEPVPNQDNHVFSPRFFGVDLHSLKDDTAFPPYIEARRLADLYFENASWMYEIIPKEIFFTVHLPHVYPTSASPTQKPIPHDVLALVAVVLALGAFFDLDLSFSAAKQRADGALKLDTIPAVQTVHLMVLYQLSTRGRGDGEAAWQLLGMAMRAIQAQGCHRDGSRWNLPERDLEERRRVFWETHTYDRLQSLTFGRPYSLSDTHHDCEMPKSCDTPLPSDTIQTDTEFSHTRWHHHKFRFAIILGRIVDEAFAVKHPTYFVIMQLDREINDFYVKLPEWMLCESVTDPIKNLQPGSGTGQRVFLRKDAQIFSFGNMIFMTKLLLHRGPFCRALMHSQEEGPKSIYESSVINLTEAARAIINISRGFFTLHPTLACRMWYFVFHSFTAATCLAVLVIVTPSHPLALLAYDSVQMALELFGLAEGDMAEIAQERVGRLAGKAKDVLEGWRQASEYENEGPNGRFPESNIRGKPEDLLGASTTLIRIQPTDDTTVDSEAVADALGGQGDTDSFQVPRQLIDLFEVPYASGISRIPFPSSMDPTWGWSDESFMNYLNSAQAIGDDPTFTQDQWMMNLNTTTNIDLNVDGFDLSSFIQNRSYCLDEF